MEYWINKICQLLDFMMNLVHGITVYDGAPDQKITLTSNPYDWLEASLFYNNIKTNLTIIYDYDPVCIRIIKIKVLILRLE